MMRLLAWVGALAILALAGLGIYGAMVVRRGFTTRDPPSSLEAAVATTMRRLSTPAHERALANPVHSTPDVLVEARAHWADHCASCHANDGSGNTELGKHLYPRVPDMRGPSTQNLTDGELYAVIKNGVRLTGMPAWGEPGDQDLESWKLVAFIRHLPVLTPAELREMEKLNPKSPHEAQEEKEEDEFLNGGDEPQESK